MQTKAEKISTGFIAENISSLHKPGVLQEAKRRYLEETKKFFTETQVGKRILREEVCVWVTCPVCKAGRTQSEFVVQVNGFDHHRCLVCKNIYVNPRLKDEFVWEQYSRPSYTYMFQNLIQSTIHFRKDVIASGKFKWVTKRLKNRNAKSLLDIGSGLGENLAVYKEHGWDVVGIEFNEYAAQKSRELFGVQALNTPIEKASFPLEHFDLITLWGVLEHLTDPVNVLKETLKFLAPDGALVLMVPNFNSLTTSYLQEHPEDADRHLDGDKHITVFTREGIEYLASLLNLKVVDMTTRGLDLVTILEYLSREKDTRLYQLIKKELPSIQTGIEEVGFGDSLWVMLSKKGDA